MTESKINEYSPLALAYLGDAVFELKVRCFIVSAGNRQAKKLHNASRNYVNAKSQSEMYLYIFEKVSEKEQGILLRGRNAKPYSIPKNASLLEYKYATGLESLFGYLKLAENETRIDEIFNLCLEAMESQI